jgi:hypothetical protein
MVGRVPWMGRSVVLATALGALISTVRRDPIISLVVAWALTAVAADLRPGVSKLRAGLVDGVSEATGGDLSCRGACDERRSR